MKVVLTFSTLFTTVLVSGLLTIALYGYMKWKKSIYTEQEVRWLLLLITLIAVRLLFPFEILHFTKSIYISEVYPAIHRFFRTAVLPHWTVFYWLCAVFGVGSAWVAYKKYKRHKWWKRNIRYTESVGVIQSEETEKHSVEILLKRLPGISEPLITGIIQPVILLPTEACKQNEMILRHELQHFRNHDLWIKLCMNVLLTLYWWNPFVYVLEKKLSELLEIRADLAVTSGMSQYEKSLYANALVQFAKQLSKDKPEISAGVSGGEFKLRVATICDGLKKPKYTKVLCILAICALLGSLVVLEPKVCPPESSDSFDREDLYKKGSYLQVIDEGYAIYIENEYQATIDHIPKDFEQMEIKE